MSDSCCGSCAGQNEDKKKENEQEKPKQEQQADKKES